MKLHKVIVSGATSMIGLALVSVCIQHDVEVIAFIRTNSSKRHLLPESDLITIIECDVSQLSSFVCKEALYSDIFFHFAWAYTDKDGRNNARLQAENITHTLDAVLFSHHHHCKRFIGAGSQAEYGYHDDIIDTSTSICPESAYGIAKYTAGMLAAQMCRDLSLDFIWARIFSVYGPNDMPTTMIMYCIDCLMRGAKPSLTWCEQQWDYLFSQDAGKAFYLLGCYGKNQEFYNIASGTYRQLSHYIEIIQQEADTGTPVGIGEKAYPSDRKPNLRANIEKLMRDTGFVVETTFQEGIRKTIDWYRQSGISTIDNIE